MALEQKLSLKLAQKLVMTPSLQQAIKLLQMTRMELDTLLTQELVENPVLEESSEIEEEEAPREEERKDKEGADWDGANGEEGGDYELAEVHAALEMVRGFDPPGIACSSLPESLLRQMDARGLAPDALARRIILEAWDLFLRRQFPAVAKRLGV